MRLNFAICLFLTACGGIAFDTEVASTEASRFAMVASVIPGHTTETGLVTRWGNPTQKVYEGGQTEFVYRDMSNPPYWYFPQFGDSNDYVIVTFQYGLATAVRTSDGVDCRATFPPRPPGPGFDNPATVRLVGGCAPPYWEVGGPAPDAKGPIATAWDTLRKRWGDLRGKVTGAGTGTRPGAATATASAGKPGVTEDGYLPGGKATGTGTK